MDRKLKRVNRQKKSIFCEMDIGKIISNASLFKQLLAVNPQSIGETKASFKSVEGLKFETSNPVTVEFE